MTLSRKSRRNLSESELRRRLNQCQTTHHTPSIEEKKIAEDSNKFKDTGIRIKNEKNSIVLTIPKNFIGKLNTFDLANHISMMVSPLFLQKDERLKNNKYESKSLDVEGLPHVAVFMNNVRHYSGGRYYAVMFSKLVASIGCKVTLVTDDIPFFISDFDDIDDRGNLTYRCDVDETIWCAKDDRNEFDLVIGVPNAAGVRGFNYAKKWNLPIYMMIFETPNYVSKYRGGLDSGEGYWADYKKCCAESDKIICLADVPMKEAISWLKEYNVPESRFTYIYPAVNSYIADSVKGEEERNEITFIGRHTDFKNPVHIVKAVSNMKCSKKPSINFIGTHSQRTGNLILETARKLGVVVRFYAKIKDYDKFRIIKRSKVICVPTSFEGFGIPPAEGLYCKKAAVVYDIPVLRNVYRDSVVYADQGDIKMLSDKIENLLIDDEYRNEIGLNGNKFVSKNCSPQAMKNKIRQIILNQKNLSITVGMIVLNSSRTIEYSLKSIYSAAKEIIIVVGAVEKYAEINPHMVSCNSDGHCIDNTVKIIESFPDPDKKITVIKGNKNKFWKNKQEMQNKIAEKVTGDIYLKVDADEIYKEYDIERIRTEFILDPHLFIFKYKFYHFWHNLNQYAVGGQWESRMTRCWRWKSDFRHDESIPGGFNYFFDSDDERVQSPKYKTKEIDDRLVYHLNYAIQGEDSILAKINYYKNRGIEKNVVDTWSDWELGKPTSPTHGGGTVKNFNGELPIVLQKNRHENLMHKDIKQKRDFNETLMESPPHKNIIVKSKSLWTIGMIVHNEEQFIKSNIVNLLNWNKLARLVVVEGADKKYKNANKHGLSTDNTTKIITELVNKKDKITYIKKGFVDSKQDLRNVYLDHSIGTHLMVVDADEFYSSDDLNKLAVEVEKSASNIIQWEFIRDNLKSNVYGGIVHFWHSLKYRVVGGYYSIPHQRIYKLIDGMRYMDSHNHPSFSNGVRFDSVRDRWGRTSARCYHAGFLKDKNNMRDKQNYYYNRGEKQTRPMYSDTRELWFNWDGKTMEYPNLKVKILDYAGFVPDSLRECL